MTNPVREAVAAAGTVSAVARQIGCSRQWLHQCMVRGRIGAEYAERLRLAAGWPPERLRELVLVPSAEDAVDGRR